MTLDLIVALKFRRAYMSSACIQETQKTKTTDKLNATKRNEAKTSCNIDAQSSQILKP